MGDVYVYLPTNVPLTIDAAIDTAAGRQIQSDFPLDIQGDKEELVPSTLARPWNVEWGRRSSEDSDRGGQHRDSQNR